MNAGIFDYHEIQPFKIFGLNGDFWTLHIDTLIYTWAAMAILFVIVLIGRSAIKKPYPTNTSVAFEKVVTFLIDLCNESFETFNYNYFAFISSIFFFTVFCCLVGLLPWLDESTKDLNTTLALGLTSFIYVQYQIIRVHGVKSFIKDLMEPFFLLAPINIVGELAKIASMSFRLFGNILGGSIIFSMAVGFAEANALFIIPTLFVLLCLDWIMKKFSIEPKNVFIKFSVKFLVILPFLFAWGQMFFGIFEGLIQSFVLTMLTTTYLSMGIGNDADHQETQEGS